MGSNFRWKLLSLVVLVGLSIYALYPSFRYYGMSEAERAALDPEKLADLRGEALKLGLDLQGGMHLVLELDRSALRDEEVPEAMARAIEIMRNRVDRFGVAEPIIQRQGTDRMLIELPGLLDKERAVKLVGQTALLEFKLVKNEQDARRVLERLDRALAERARGADAAADTADLGLIHPLTDLMPYWPDMPWGAAFIPETDVPKARALMESVRIDSLIPIDAQVLWGKSPETYQGYRGRLLYVLDRRPQLTGKGLANAVRRIGIDPTMPNAAGVSLTFNAEGARVFRRVTAQNVNRLLAIVLDDQVVSAPRIKERIPTQRAQITGSFTDEEAKDLATVLQAGALPAPVNIIQEMTVGPSLGADSIRKGTTAALIGAAIVVLFMVVYYRASGLVAVFALFFNMLFLFAALAGMRGTVTLPGIAGMALTVGMAVDANVLIFERIREELGTGKKIRGAIDAGFNRAFRAIFDSNVTTMISAGVLWWIASGPIQGFATTLFIGILANLYTAVMISRMVFDVYTSRPGAEGLSI
jgi:protein-export membrane protein SecD